jgi:Asp-tRNA(Asn)/Glu-tRNA(Gln) amidotransferase A subunit family amidase
MWWILLCGGRYEKFKYWVVQVTLPIANVDGCPVGLSFIGPRDSDEALLSMAAELMKVFQGAA